MPTKFKVKRSTVSGVTPTTGDIDTGELAINLPDRKLFTSNGSAVYELGSNQTNLSVSANLTIGASGDLVLTSGAGIYANGSLGTTGQILASNGTSVYWAAASGTGTVTSVATGNGLTGGPITTTGTISVLANNGIVANTTGIFVNANTGLVANVTGVYVNSTYIGTLSANNTTYLNGQLAAYYTNATNITTGTLPWAQAPTGTVNTSGTFTFSGIQTYNANVVIGSTGELVFNTAAGIYANGSLGTAGQVLTSNATTVYWSTPTTGTVTSVATGNGLTGGPVTSTGTVSVLANSGIVANTTGVYVNANTGLVANATGVYVNATYIGTLSANNTTYLNGQLASYYTNATNITTGTLPWAQAPTGTVNTSGAFTFSGIQTFNANVVIGSSGELVFNTAAGIYANGSLGTDGQVLTTNGTTVYWATAASGGSVNTSAQYVWSNTQTFQANVAFTSTAASGNATSGAVLLSGGLGVANNIYAAGRLGFSNSTNISVAYQYYNASNNSIDTVFG